MLCSRRCVEDDPDVHHDVDEQAVGGQEAAQVATLLVEARCKRAAGVDYDVVLRPIAGQLVPAPPRRPEQKAEVVDVAVVLARLEEVAVALSLLAEPWVVCARGEQPQLTGEEA